MPKIPPQIHTEEQLREIALPAECQLDPSRNNQFVPNVQSSDHEEDPGYENVPGLLEELESTKLLRNNSIASLDQCSEREKGPYDYASPEFPDDTNEIPSNESAASSIHSSEDEEYSKYSDPGYEHLPGVSEKTNKHQDAPNPALQILAESRKEGLHYESDDIYNNNLQEGVEAAADTAECHKIVDFSHDDSMSFSITPTEITLPPKPAPRRPPRHFERDMNISSQLSKNIQSFSDQTSNQSNNNDEIEDGYEPLWNDSEKTKVSQFDTGCTDDSEYDYTKSSRDTYLKLKNLIDAKGDTKFDCNNDDETYDYSTPYEPISPSMIKDQSFQISYSSSPDSDEYDRIAVIEKLHADLSQVDENYCHYYENATDIDVKESVQSSSKSIKSKVTVIKSGEVFV